MLHLLVFAYALKALELNNKKDFYQLFLLGLFILATSLIFNQSLIFSLMLVVIVIINLSVLLQHYSPTEHYKTLFVTSGKLFLQSLPLAVVLFIVFPRLAPFWQVPRSNSATTGLSDRVSPGDIANLARSNELAFRVTFDGVKPSYSQLYWRALVLEDFDGNSWQRAEKNKAQAKIIRREQLSYQVNITEPSPSAKLTAPSLPSASISYQVIAQPSYQHWLFGLDIAEISSKTANYSSFVELPDFTLQAKEVVSQTLSYHVNSYLQAPLDVVISNELKERNLNFPEGSNPKLQQEANRLRQLYSDDMELAQAVLDSFREQKFYYTLKPPLLFDNTLDQFYFDTKQGFCAHYASAFTYLMRASGIPARMVTGYLGGEYNPNGDYYAIYQYEAHAWSEIWLAGKGWVRIDPTSAVDPQRVDNGFSAELLLEQASFNDSFFNFSSYRNLPIIKALRLNFAAIDYQWTRMVIGYTSKRQYDLLAQWFGKMKPWKTAAIIAVSFFSIILLLVLLRHLAQLKTVKQHQAPWLTIYQQALLLYSTKGITKPQAMTVSEFFTMSSEKLVSSESNTNKKTINKKTISEIVISFNKLTQCFIKLQYQELTFIEQKKLVKNMQISYLTIKTKINE